MDFFGYTDTVTTLALAAASVAPPTQKHELIVNNLDVMSEFL